MKSKTLSLVFTLVLCIGGLCSKAQSQWISKSSFSIGPEVLFPLNTTSNGDHSNAYYRDGGGFSATFEVPVIDHLKFTFSAGYQYYNPINPVYVSQVYFTCPGCTLPAIQGPPPQKNAYKFIPVMAGLRDYFIQYLYINLEAGEAIKTGPETTNSFIYGGGLGGFVPFDKLNALDITTGVERGFKSIYFDYPESQLYIKLAYKHRF